MLHVSWPAGEIPQNLSTAIAFAGWVYSQPTSALFAYDASTNTPMGIIDQPYMFQQQTSADLNPSIQTQAPGYLAAITYPGLITAVPDLSTFGYCGRSTRVQFTK